MDLTKDLDDRNALTYKVQGSKEGYLEVLSSRSQSFSASPIDLDDACSRMLSSRAPSFFSFNFHLHAFRRMLQRVGWAFKIAVNRLLPLRTIAPALSYQLSTTSKSFESTLPPASSTLFSSTLVDLSSARNPVSVSLASTTKSPKLRFVDVLGQKVTEEQHAGQLRFLLLAAFFFFASPTLTPPLWSLSLPAIISDLSIPLIIQAGPGTGSISFLPSFLFSSWCVVQTRRAHLLPSYLSSSPVLIQERPTSSLFG